LYSVELPSQYLNHSQSSPEYKSPLPPFELFHEFPPPSHGTDQADAEIDYMWNAVLKQGQDKPILCPTMSLLGQSASSFHVHVNIVHPTAWPRLERHEQNDLTLTQSLLSVVCQYIRFDNVIAAAFCQPWMVRDRSFVPLHPAGSEFLFHQRAWHNGTSGFGPEETASSKGPSVAQFFRHAFETYHGRESGVLRRKLEDSDSSDDEMEHNHDNDEEDQDFHRQTASLFDRISKDHEEKKESHQDDDNVPSTTASLFDRIFDHDVIAQTLYRRNSLNLYCLQKYGTIEFRRMHATLDADFVRAWTWFCTGFVEATSARYQELSARYWEDAPNWWTGLERLVTDQDEATLEDLMELLEGHVPPSTFPTLLASIRQVE